LRLAWPRPQVERTGHLIYVGATPDLALPFISCVDSSFRRAWFAVARSALFPGAVNEAAPAPDTAAAPQTDDELRGQRRRLGRNTEKGRLSAAATGATVEVVLMKLNLPFAVTQLDTATITPRVGGLLLPWARWHTEHEGPVRERGREGGATCSG